ncbi:hypothetical protein WH06_11395 [Aeromonas salmonicida subsp. salmonicida]|uniref:DUF2066 domain-containing protein n=2 Tax=Aeromonas salmonicida subsp. salmonicida TaxID=29491 RepID=A4SL30_AERS4|nr:DUF2066 domain-containing protein [Aeromonas salmonicida]ABO89602.1 conserved hypothetical protein [Aeromonas salmonicida subsp. salmonicida A449]AYO62698.1 DUF2066 domain-containing protein [Aeromonas salmonicida subsp. salmonicida 01-B526]EHI50598.1 hypothetical protein IYQ_20731 [Aeromonas salmonicida subsp. salmonicida 01-B526]EKP0239894.1 DUF2066 domain-containing protein [Aeromonas salmonicida]EKP0244077.1 DUF2066 domain-containing protein [Aeromonas salmonicida]
MLKRVVTVLCCGLSFMVSAAQVTDLYQGKAPTSGDMVAAQSQALGDVLVKVTGKRDILTQPDVVKALAAPGDYVQHYGYQDVGPVKFLKADFNVAKVNALISQSKFALLGPARPQMALWLVINEGERRILPDQSSDGWASALRTQSQAMGLPVSIPLMDLDDNMAVNATDVWGRFAAPILQASQRYGAEMVVLGKLTPEGDKWSIDWGLYGPKAGGELAELTRGSSSGTQAEVAQHFADELAAWLVQNYGARISGVASSQTLVVEGLSGIDGMITVQKMLQGMASVTKVTIGKLEGDKVTFDLSLQGDKAELIRGLQLESRLRQIDDNDSGLRYQWSQP